MDDAERSGRMEPLGDALARAIKRAGRETHVTDLPDERLLEVASVDVLENQLAKLLARKPREENSEPTSRVTLRDRQIAFVREQIDLARERLRRAEERGRPDGCWCLGLGGKGKRFLPVQPGDQTPDDQLPFVFHEYCGCGDGLARSAADAVLRRNGIEAARRNRINAVWQDSGVPESYATATLRTYPQDTEDQRRTLRRIRKWLVDPERARRWLYLHGPVGRGKTGLAAAIARELADQPVRFETVPNLLARLRAVMIGDGYDKAEKLLDTLIDVDVLILDDLGAEKVTDWTTEALFRLIDKRKNGLRRTVITSNLGTDKLGGLIGERTASRIDEMSDVIAVEGPNLRLAEALPW